MRQLFPESSSRPPVRQIPPRPDASSEASPEAAARGAPAQEPIIRLLIADDHPIVRRGIAALLNRKPGLSVAAEAGGGREAVDLFRLHQPDVTLMDLRMPGTDGVEAIRIILQQFPQARIIVLTTYDTDEDIYQGLRSGAVGYLLKDAQPDALVQAIHAVHAGRKCIPPEVAHRLLERLNTPELTAREREVLRLIVAGQSNKEIGASLSISEGTVRAHLNNVFAKMNVSDRTQAATQAIQRGLVRLESSLT